MPDTTGFNEFPWTTAIIAVIALIVVVVGGAVVIWGDGALSYEDYLDNLVKFGVAVGLLGVGRGIRSGAKFLSTRR